MQEMQINTVKNYFKEIIRLGEQHSIFYCKNYDYSRQKYSAFKDYPWDSMGEIIYDGIAPFATPQFPQEGLKHLIRIVNVHK